MPKRYGSYTTCYNRFVRWRCAGVWDRILTAIAHRDDAEVQMVDKADDSDAIRSVVVASGGWANIPPRRNRRDPICFSPFLYRDRNLVERFFNRIKHCRRIATRYEKRAANFLAFVKLAAIRIWLRFYESTAL